MSDKETSVNLNAYNINGYDAPDRCEKCEVSLPDKDARKQHVSETRHRACPFCEKYVPVGGFYVHCDIVHPQEHWNDHQVAYQDKFDRQQAPAWLGVKE